MLDNDAPSRLLVGVLGRLARALLMRGGSGRRRMQARAVTAARGSGTARRSPACSRARPGPAAPSRRSGSSRS